jgi:hypothetical protein
MKITTKIKLAISAFTASTLIFAGGSALAAPLAPAVTPTTITTGGTVQVTMKCTVEGNVIDAVYLNPAGGSQTEVSSFVDHTCTASDVTTGYTEPIVITLTGSSSTTTTITFNESGSTAGGSPGISPASNSITVNPDTSNQTAVLEYTGSTVALDGSNPITNNMWLKHTYTIKNTGSASLVIGDDADEYFAFWSGHWGDDKSSIISDGGLQQCVVEDFRVKCSSMTIAPGQTITFSFKSYFQDCNSTYTTGGTYQQDISPGISSSSGGYDDNGDTASHTFSYKYIGCDYNPNDVGNTSNTSAIKVPKTGFSGLASSLVVVMAGLGLAGGSILAINKFRG